MEYLVLALLILGFIVIVMCKGLWDERRKKKKFEIWLGENYGVLPKREPYKTEDFQKISRYYEEHKKDSFFVDDITWNDLGMDNAFKNLNYTYSAAGEEYLYYMLRTPAQNKEHMDKMEKHIKYFTENKEERMRYQIFFAGLGKTGKYSIYDYLKNLELLGKRSNWNHYAGIAAMLISIGLMFFSVQIGVVFLILSVSRNIISYFKVKNEIDPYIICFAYILRIMQSAEKMEKMPAETFSAEINNLMECRRKMHKFKAGSYIVMSQERMSASSNPLEMVLDYVRMMFHIDLIKFNSMLVEVRENIDVIDRMITLIGYMECMIAIGAYRASLETYCLPEFAGKELRIDDMYHPLIDEPVKNSIVTEKGVLLTGSNASGKSTFLKTVAINVIFAQSIHTCLAKNYSGDLYRIFSSMALRDDLTSGESYYIVEIKSLKRILNQVSEEGNKVLCFVDEVLRGTNTVERIAASTQILRSLSVDDVICFAATHDIELTHLLEREYDNYHFEEEIAEDDIVFNYKLKEGRATTRNAIKLLGVMGYEKEIINKAEDMAESFLKKGTWQ